jgi:hypothetical protein
VEPGASEWRFIHWGGPVPVPSLGPTLRPRSPRLEIAGAQCAFLTSPSPIGNQQMQPRVGAELAVHVSGNPIIPTCRN